MTIRILYIMRSPGPSPSIERVFRQIGKCLSSDEFEVDFQELPYPTTSVNLLLNLVRFRPQRADIYHVTGDVNYISLRLPRSRTVLTIHDLIFLHVRSGIRRYVLKKLLLTWPLKRLQYVTAISEATKKEIVAEAGPAGDKVRVIENPLVDGFDAEPRRRFDPGEPIILHIGTAPNKNLDRLVDALTGLQCRLRVIGELNAPQREHLTRSGIRFSATAGLSQEQMSDEYRRCDILSFCTTYEGFGLPVIEAQAMMKPVLASNIEPMASIAGGGALLVDPHSPAAIREGMVRLIADEALRNSLVEKGSQNISRFRATAIAEQYAACYRTMAAEGSARS